MEPRNRFQFMNSDILCSLTGRYDNPIPTRCLAPIDCLKIPALNVQYMSASGFDLKGLYQALKKLVFVLFEQRVHICILTRSRAKTGIFHAKIYDSTRSWFSNVFWLFLEEANKKNFTPIVWNCMKFIHQLDGHKITLIKKTVKTLPPILRQLDIYRVKIHIWEVRFFSQKGKCANIQYYMILTIFFTRVFYTVTWYKEITGVYLIHMRTSYKCNQKYLQKNRNEKGSLSYYFLAINVIFM
jgi:hypothetical protein